MQVPSCKTEESTKVPERMRLVNVRIPNPPNNLNLDLENVLSFGQWIAVAQGDNFNGVYQWPDGLIIQLERFEWVIDTEVWKKQEMVKYSMKEVTMPGVIKYVIRTVVCHVGDTSYADQYYAMSYATEKDKEAYAQKDAKLKAQARREEQELREREPLTVTAANIKAKTEAMPQKVVEEEAKGET
ncbi:hypothetical protein OPT61_g3321 [Boeremia exigua]|uniref:Uncharacterized protein n=1 Tax=Boeremia exigua TaxID=749465 RepID=A0ACC2III7_9PLEO|nr:hypothetical protein OPT61_g3321 [Boeremia exigua]